MGLKNDDFPASASFDLIQEAFKDDDTRQAAIKDGDGLFVFTLKNKAGKEESWYIDLRETGEVGAGQGPDTPTVTIRVPDREFADLVAGKANPTRLFMTGKLKVKGNMGKATKLEAIFGSVRTKSKL